ncbi:hypothetical protein JCM9492_04350 [Aquifex pyrophilus]
MPLVPTSKPLTVKDFDKAVCGVCSGCSASCGYIAYLKGEKLVDLYGHPHDPNGIGSFCTKGITYIQEIPQNPLRITKPLIREGDNFKEISLETAKKLLGELIKGKVAFFLDRFSGIEEYLIARSITEEIFTDSVYLPFLQTSIRAQEWVNKKALFIFEAEPTFSEVMLTRWIVDAFEKDAFIFTAGSRYTTVFQKSTQKVLTNPKEVIKILEAISEEDYEEKILNFLKLLGRDTVLIVGETLLKSPFKNRVLRAVKKIREKFGSDYSFVGNITPLPHKSLKEFIERAEEFDTLILFGNPFIYLPDEKIKLLREKNVINFAYFPTITANNSLLILPRTLFCEREFIGKGFGFLTYSPKVLEAPFPNPHEFFEGSYNIEEFLKEYGIKLEELKEKEGGVSLKMRDIKDYEVEDWEEREEGDLWLVCDNTLVEELGHWNPWTHAIEREQFAQVNSKTFEKVGETLKLGEVSLKVQINENIAEGVVFVPNAYEEFQPFDPGVRVGRIMRKPYLKVERLKL